MGKLIRDPNVQSTKLIQRHKGVKVVKNPKNGFSTIWLHYSADPNKTPEWAEGERASYPSIDKWNQEMEIDFTKSSGRRVFPMGSEEAHICALTPIPNIPIWRCWDFGFHHPACVFLQVTPREEVHVLAEMLGLDMTIAAFGKKVLDFSWKQFHGWHFKDAGDPAGAQVSDKSEDSSMDILRDSRNSYGFKTHPAGPVRMQHRKLRTAKGIELIQTLMLPAPGTGSEFMTDEGADIPAFIRFKVNNRMCDDVIDGMMGGYRLKEGTDDPEKDGYYDHLWDGLRYGIQVIFNHVTCRVMGMMRVIKKKGHGTQSKVTGY